MLLIAYLSTGTLLVQSSNYAMSINAWDALFSIFANQYAVFFVLTPLFLYLVSDFLPESELGQALLLRLGSRRWWWQGKVATLAWAVVVYLVTSVGLVAGVVSFVLPWQDAWSQTARQFSAEIRINPAALSLSPLSAFAQLIPLLALGWFSLGLFGLVVTLRFDRAIAGFGAGILALLSGYAALMVDVRPPISYLFIHQHLLFNLHSFGERASPYPPIMLSVLYWILWSVLLIGLGLRLSRRQDFLSQGSRA